MEPEICSKEIKRVTVEVPSEFHKELKAQCVFRNVTIQKYVIRAIAEQLAKDKQYST